MTAGVGCHTGRYSLLAVLAAPEPKKGLTGDAHSQIKRPVSAVAFGLPLPGIATDGASGKPDGAIAQLGERLLCKQEVVGSIPSGSTIFSSCFLTFHGYRPCLARRRVFVACHSYSDMKARAWVTGRGRNSCQDAHEHIVRFAFR